MPEPTCLYDELDAETKDYADAQAKAIVDKLLHKYRGDPHQLYMAIGCVGIALVSTLYKSAYPVMTPAQKDDMKADILYTIQLCFETVEQG